MALGREGFDTPFRCREPVARSEPPLPRRQSHPGCRVEPAHLESPLEELERVLVLAGVEARPAEIVEQRPRPVGGYRLSLAEIESALRPLLHRRAIVRHGESAHVSSVSGEVVLARITRTREGC